MSKKEDYNFENVQSIGRMPTIDPVAFGILFPWGVAPVMAGPYSEKPENSPGILLIEGSNVPHMVGCPIKDFSVPNPKLIESALLSTIVLMKGGQIPYVGCFGGLGRTGLFIALLVKVAHQATRRWWDFRTVDYVGMTRALYRPEAIETKEQEKFVREFDVSWLVRRVKALR